MPQIRSGTNKAWENHHGQKRNPRIASRPLHSHHSMFSNAHLLCSFVGHFELFFLKKEHYIYS